MAESGTRRNAQTRTVPPTKVELIDVSAADATFDPPLRAISIGTAGDLKVDTVDSTGVVIPSNALAIGIQHSCEITKIYNSGTGASELVGWT